METFASPVTYLSFVIGILAFIMTWQTFKNGKVFKMHFVKLEDILVKMDERFIKMDERAEQRHLEVVQIMKQQHNDVVKILDKMDQHLVKMDQQIDKGFGIIINEVSEIKNAK